MMFLSFAKRNKSIAIIANNTRAKTENIAYIQSLSSGQPSDELLSPDGSPAQASRVVAVEVGLDAIVEVSVVVAVLVGEVVRVEVPDDDCVVVVVALVLGVVV